MNLNRHLLLIGIALVSSLAACGGGGAGEVASSSSTFYYNDPDGLNTLDPARIGARSPWQIGGQIFIGLVGLDSALRPIPQIAKSWTVSPDGLRWTFNLRGDVFFADDASFSGGKGRAVTAEDVRYSFERILDPATSSSGVWVFSGKVRGAAEHFEARRTDSVAGAGHVPGFQVVDDTTFVIELEKPFPPFLSILSMPYCYIVPREAVEKYGDEFFRNPVGAGAFRLAEWSPDQRIVLVRNERYYERDAGGARLPYLDSVVVSFVKDVKTEYLEYKEGRLDAVGTIDPAFTDEVFAADAKSLAPTLEGHHLHATPAMSVEYYGFLLDSTRPGAKGSPLAGNRHLRRAINYAIDRDAIVRYVLKGRAAVGVNGPIPPGTPGFSNVAGFRFDRELARRLLDSAGYPGGKGLPPLVLQMGHSERSASVAEALQDQLATVGITLELRQVNSPQHREMYLAGKLPFFRANWMADYPDAENFLSLFYSEYAPPAGNNTTGFRNARFDSLYRAALGPSMTIEQRSALYNEAERIILDQSPWVILYYSVIQRLTQPWISGYAVDPLDRLDLTRVRKVSL
ncbi:MAG TPA: ABC transporter substrate-binding protein [Candidatus Kapabacteria bacterium]|nr:ABC transporter substrate-binding protein [Candidatus Kapabacteria bacterium]